MPKLPTFPTVLDYQMQISVADLKRIGYWALGQRRSGSINWKSGVSIGVVVDLAGANPYLELNYTYFDRPIRYRVYFTKLRSNLGVGDVWYFICPQTGKRCRTLYAVDGYFLHREAFSDAVYDCQTWSESQRGMAALVRMVMNKPPKRRFYRGTPTKRYMRWLSKYGRYETRTVRSGLLETHRRRHGG